MLEQRGQRHVPGRQGRSSVPHGRSAGAIYTFPPPLLRYGRADELGNAKAAKFVAPGDGQGGAVRRKPAGAPFAGLRQLFTQITNIIAAHRAGEAGNGGRADPALAASSSIEALAVKLRFCRIKVATRDSPGTKAAHSFLQLTYDIHPHVPFGKTRI